MQDSFLSTGTSGGLALIPSVLLAWATLGLPAAIIVFVGYVIINGTAENLVKPRLMGEGLEISPLIVFVSLVFWGWVLGGVGAILAVPLTLLVLSILRSFEATRWIAALAASEQSDEGERHLAFGRLGNAWQSVTHARAVKTIHKRAQPRRSRHRGRLVIVVVAVVGGLLLLLLSAHQLRDGLATYREGLDKGWLLSKGRWQRSARWPPPRWVRSAVIV